MPFSKNDPNINRNGRPKQPEIQELRDAMAKAKDKHGDTTILEHFVENAYTDNKVLVALVKKILPDKTQLDAEVSGNVTVMPSVIIDDKEMEFKVGDTTT